MSNKPDITMFTNADDIDIASYKASDENKAVRGLRVTIRHAKRFEPSDWNGRKVNPPSVKGARIDEIIEKFQSMGTAISRQTLSDLYHNHVVQFVRTDKDGNETWDYAKMDARLADIKSEKVEAYPNREKVSWTRQTQGARVSKCERLALELKAKTPSEIMAIAGTADLYTQLKRAYKK